MAFVAQRVFGHHLVFAFAQQQADGGVVEFVFHLLVHGGHVKAQLAQMLGLEFAALEFDHHVAAQFQVVKKQVDEEFVAAHIQQNLAADEGKARPQLQQEFGDMFNQGMLHLAFLRLIGQTQEVETVGVFDGFAGQIGLRFGQAGLEVGDGGAAALNRAGFDLHHQHIARPVVFNGLGCVPAARVGAG